jgi:hypothetical protein
MILTKASYVGSYSIASHYGHTGFTQRIHVYSQDDRTLLRKETLART